MFFATLLQNKMMEDLSYNSVVSRVRVPDSILQYFPSQEVLFHGQGKNLQRNIFKHQTFTAREQEKIKRLREMILKQKLAIPEDWDDSELLKFVYGSGFKTRNSFKSLRSCLESRFEVFPEPLPALYPKILEILVKPIQKTGPLYFHGRDENYRPLLVMNFAKFDLKKVLFSQYSFEQYLQSACFVLEFAGKHMLYPGRVENWMCISDLGFKGLGDLPLNTLRKITKVLQDVFKCRLAYSAMINVPKSIYFIYSCLKPFLDEVTIDKISIVKDNVATNIIQHFNPYQVEERYGGKAKNLEVFWPPCFPDCPVQVDGGPEHLIPESLKSSLAEVNEDYQQSVEKSCLSQPVVEFLQDDQDLQNTEQNVRKKHKKKKRKERKLRKKLRKTLEMQESEEVHNIQESEETSRREFEKQPSLKEKKTKARKTEEHVRDFDSVELNIERKEEKLNKSIDDAVEEKHIEIERSSVETFCGIEQRCIMQ